MRSAQLVLPSISDLNVLFEVVLCVEDEEYNAENMVAAVGDRLIISSEQAQLYLETAEYFSLIRHTSAENYVMATTGIALFNAPLPEKRIVLAEAVVNSWIFAELANIARRSGSFGGEDIDSIIAGVLKPDGSPRYTSTTVGRRSQTIRAWLGWLTEEIGCFKEEGSRYTLS